MQRRQAQNLTALLFAVRDGLVDVPDHLYRQMTFSVVKIPPSLKGYVTGSRGATLKALEEHHNVFAIFTGMDDLCIFGRPQRRQQACSEVSAMLARRLGRTPPENQENRSCHHHRCPAKL